MQRLIAMDSCHAAMDARDVADRLRPGPPSTGARLGAACHRRAGRVTRYPVAVRQRALLVFVALNFLAAGLHAQRFLFAEDALPSSLGLAFAALALLAQVGLATLALHAVLGAVALVDSWALATRCLAALAFTLLQAFIYVDARIYGFFRFHFNALALNVLLTPGGFESMELPSRDVVMASAGIAILLGLELLGYTALLRRARAADVAGPASLARARGHGPGARRGRAADVRRRRSPRYPRGRSPDAAHPALRAPPAPRGPPAATDPGRCRSSDL